MKDHIIDIATIVFHYHLDNACHYMTIFLGGDKDKAVTIPLSKYQVDIINKFYPNVTFKPQ